MLQFCNDCSNSCLDVVTDNCIRYTGPDIDSLGVKTNDSLSTVISKISAVLGTIAGVEASLAAMQEQLDGFTAGKINADVSLMQGKVSVAATKITDRSFTYSITRNKGELTVTYDVNAVRKNLPEGYALVETRASLTEADGNTKTTKGTVSTIKTSVVPAVLDIVATVRTNSGDIQLNKQIPVVDAMGSRKLNFGVKDFTTTPDDVTQGEVNSIFSESINHLRDEVDDADIVGIKSSVGDLLSRVAALETNQ